MEKSYRLEFNEKQQLFNLSDGTVKPNTFGWFTVIGSCTCFEFMFYEAYVNRVPKKTLTKKYLLKCAVEVMWIVSNLSENHGAEMKIGWQKKRPFSLCREKGLTN